MPRILLLSLIVLLLPSFIYLTVAYFARKDDDHAILARAPILSLLMIGFLMMIGALAYLVEMDRGGRPGQKYYPPVVKDGVLQPGHSE